MSGEEVQVITTKTPCRWKIELNNDVWVLMMSALTSAITLEVQNGRAEGDQAHKLTALRTAPLEHLDKSKGI